MTSERKFWIFAAIEAFSSAGIVYPDRNWDREVSEMALAFLEERSGVPQVGHFCVVAYPFKDESSSPL